MKFKVGDKVDTIWGKFKVVALDADDHDSMPYLCYQKDFKGHSGTMYELKEGSEIKKKHIGHIWWFSEDELSVIKKSS